MTPTKSAAVREAAHEGAPSPAAQPVQFTPARKPAPTPQPAPPAPPAAEPAAPPPTPMVVKRRRPGPTRFIMLVVVPLIALALGFGWWLNGGRYVTTDNSYVGAQKVLITPQVTGSIVAVHVVEGQMSKRATRCSTSIRSPTGLRSRWPRAGSTRQRSRSPI